ncbi:TolB family protein [Paracoccus sp. (in: a-proteobacteria)]|uniref:TolB family protein n=1 Tax=Paracoccus sp. TaxID=267 RepID=UPI003A83EEA0
MGWRSSLEICDPVTGALRVVLRSDRLIEAPNWHPEGWFLVNAEGRLWRADGQGLHAIDTGGLTRCNNDHGFLPDGRIVFSCHDGQGSGIYAVDPDGPRELLPQRPSWWHGASGGRIAYACARGGDRVVRIATLDLASRTEQVLTPGIAHHDGPDFSACGRFIWFNSDATGHAQIWRMAADGSGAAPVFRDGNVNWFPHPSPCGGHVLYLAYPPGTLGHPRDLDVSLWVMRPDGAERRRLVDLFGGQGTINTPCWSPDGRGFAFMRYAPGSGGAG